MKLAVAIQRGVGNATDDSDNGEIMADDNNFFRLRVPRCDKVQTHPGTLRNVDEALAAGNLEFGRFGAPTGEKLTIVVLNFVKGQTLQVTVIKFPDTLINDHRKSMMCADQLGRAPRSLEIARVNGVNRFITQARGDFLGLSQAGFTQITITGTLTAMLQVPISGAMAD